jgi:YtkA-like
MKLVHRRQVPPAIRAVVACLGAIVAASLLLIVTTQQAAATPPEHTTTQLVGPGRVNMVLRTGELTLRLSIRPNLAAAWNKTVLTVSQNGRPIRHAAVTLDFTMLSMSMGSATFHLSEEHPGQFIYAGPATVMPGDWKLTFHIRPQTGAALTAPVEDHVNS